MTRSSAQIMLYTIIASLGVKIFMTYIYNIMNANNTIHEISLYYSEMSIFIDTISYYCTGLVLLCMISILLMDKLPLTYDSNKALAILVCHIMHIRILYSNIPSLLNTNDLENLLSIAQTILIVLFSFKLLLFMTILELSDTKQGNILFKMLMFIYCTLYIVGILYTLYYLFEIENLAKSL